MAAAVSTAVAVMYFELLLHPESGAGFQNKMLKKLCIRRAFSV